MVTQQEIQRNIKEAIEKSNKKQIEIAKSINVKPTQITAYKKGRKYPSLETLANLCIELDISSDEILGIKKF